MTQEMLLLANDSRGENNFPSILLGSCLRPLSVTKARVAEEKQRCKSPIYPGKLSKSLEWPCTSLKPSSVKTQKFGVGKAVLGSYQGITVTKGTKLMQI